MAVQDIIVYGVLALLYLLTIILLGVDVDNIDQYSELIPQSTARIHIAALVSSFSSFNSLKVVLQSSNKTILYSFEREVHIVWGYLLSSIFPKDSE